MMKKQAIVTILVAALAMFGCAAYVLLSGTAARIVVGPRDVPENGVLAGTINAYAGQEIVIKLKSNPTTGYSWLLADELDAKILEFKGSKYVPDAVAAGIVGSGGQEVWTFMALAPGKDEISLKYVRPWEAGARPAAIRAVYSVIVKKK
jgi:predicted secreted protein